MKRGSAGTVGLAALLLCSFAYCVRAGDGSPTTKASGGWPERFGERTLYYSDYAFVYAKNKSAARQAQQMLADVVKDAKQDGATGATAGLVLVLDVKEKFPFEIDPFVEAMGRVRTQEANEPSDKGAKSLAEAKEQLGKLGLDLETMLSMMPISIRPPVLREIAPELPEDLNRQIAWCVVVPTGKCTKAAFKKMIDAVMKKEKLGLAKRAAAAAMMPLIERKMASQMNKVRQAILYGLLLEARQDLSADQKKQEVDAYKHKLGLDEDFKVVGSDKEATPSDEQATPAAQDE